MSYSISIVFPLSPNSISSKNNTIDIKNGGIPAESSNISIKIDGEYVETITAKRDSTSQTYWTDAYYAIPRTLISTWDNGSSHTILAETEVYSASATATFKKLNSLPEISLAPSNTVKTDTAPEFTMTITEYDSSDKETATLTGAITRTISEFSPSDAQKITISKDEFDVFPIGDNVINISVSDSNGGTATDSITITKYNDAPYILVPTSSLGKINYPPHIQFEVTDKENDAVTVTIQVDSGEVLKTYDNISLGTLYDYVMSKADYDAVSIGTHTLKIKAKDKYNITTADNNFTKYDNTPVITPVAPTASLALGNRSDGFDVAFKITDSENDATSVTVSLDGTVIKTIDSATLNQTLTATVTDAQVKAFSLGTNHTVNVTAKDKYSTAAADYTFTRVASAPQINIPQSDLGTLNNIYDFSFKYTVISSDNSACSASVDIDGTVIQRLASVTLGAENTVTVTKDMLSKYSLAAHTINIIATNASNVSTNGTISLTLYHKDITGWTDLATNYNDAEFDGSRKYNLTQNTDGTVSLEDKTTYKTTENVYIGAKDVNSMNAAMNTIMDMAENGTDLYELLKSALADYEKSSKDAVDKTAADFEKQLGVSFKGDKGDKGDTGTSGISFATTEPTTVANGEIVFVYEV